MKKKFILLFFIFFPQYLLADEGIVYLDVQYIVDNSNLGKIYKNELKKTQQKNNQDIKKIKSVILNNHKILG